MKRKEFVKLAATSVFAIGTGVSVGGQVFSEAYPSEQPLVARQNL
jgi:hypothetical protein